MRRSGPDPEQRGPAQEARVDLSDGTRERILDAAVTVLHDVGHGQFSVQKVAREAGVYQGNITYYWPRRRDLMLALGLRIVEDYRSACLAILDAGDQPPLERAQGVVRGMVEEAARPRWVRILPELWSMANADPDIARAVQQVHDDVLVTMLGALGVTEDQPCSDDVLGALVLIGAAIQGLTAVHGHRSADDPVLLAVKRAIEDHHVALLGDALAGCGGPVAR